LLRFASLVAMVVRPAATAAAATAAAAAATIEAVFVAVPFSDETHRGVCASFEVVVALRQELCHTFTNPRTRACPRP
jgi:precorrin-3B methylase